MDLKKKKTEELSKKKKLLEVTFFFSLLIFQDLDKYIRTKAVNARPEKKNKEPVTKKKKIKILKASSADESDDYIQQALSAINSKWILSTAIQRVGYTLFSFGHG